MRSLALLLLLALLGGCDLFAPREAEPPRTGGSDFLQPDTPERVVANIQNAVATPNTDGYQRSLAPAFTFVPAADAENAFPSVPWATWGRDEEMAAFNALASAAVPGTEFALSLSDPSPRLVEESRAVVESDYRLIAPHRRPPAVPDTVRGRLSWTLVEDGQGQWSLFRWTDAASGGATWSDLKGAFYP